MTGRLDTGSHLDCQREREPMEYSELVAGVGDDAWHALARSPQVPGAWPPSLPNVAGRRDGGVEMILRALAPSGRLPCGTEKGNLMLRVLPSIAGFERRAAASLALTAALSLLPLAAAAAGRTTERLEAPTSATERFGRSVALSGNLGLVGATGALDEVFFVRQTGIGWTHDGSFDSGDAPGAPGMTIVDFGLAVALDGNVAVVGAPSTSRFSNNLFESSVGAAWVFHRVLTGSPPFVFYAQPPGRAYTFSRPTHLTTWSSGAELVLPPNTDAYLYGWRVAAEGQHAIGLLPAAPYRVGVFDLSGAPRWVGSLAPHEAPSDYLYHELAMSNGVVAIGDWPAESYGLTARGAVYRSSPTTSKAAAPPCGPRRCPDRAGNRGGTTTQSLTSGRTSATVSLAPWRARSASVRE